MELSSAAEQIPSKVPCWFAVPLKKLGKQMEILNIQCMVYDRSFSSVIGIIANWSHFLRSLCPAIKETDGQNSGLTEW